MSLSLADFWSLVAQSQLVGPEICDRLAEEFDSRPEKSVRQNGAAQALAQWLVAGNKLTRWQAETLLSGAAGPFDFAEYRLRAPIGLESSRGSLAGCFRAVHSPSGHPVVIRFFEPADLRPFASQADPSGWTDLVGRIRDYAQFASPYLSRCFEPLDLGRYRLVVLEEPPGVTVAERIAQKSLSIQASCSLVYQVAQGLAEIHGANRVHGAVRPENIWLGSSRGSERREPALLAKLIFAPWETNRPSDTISASAAAGTVSYVAPELLGKEQRATTQTDVYALGRLFHVLVSRELARREKRAGGKPDKALPAVLKTLIQTMTSSEPKLRFESAADVVAALAPILQEKTAFKPLAEENSTLSAYLASIQRRWPAIATRENVSDSFPSLQEFGASQTTSPNADAFPTVNIETTSAPLRARGDKRAGRESPAASRRNNDKSGRKRNAAVWLILATAAMILCVIIGFFLFGRSDDSELTAENGNPTAPANGGGSAQNSSGADSEETRQSAGNPDSKSGTSQSSDTQTPATQSREIMIPDDGETLWASPTAGPANSLRYMPPGAQLYAFLRPAELANHADYEKLRSALGPWDESLETTVRSQTGFELGEIERLTVGIQAPSRGALAATYLVRLSEPTNVEQLAERWNNAASVMHKTKTYLKSGERAIYLPPEENGRLFVVGTEPEIREVLEIDGAAPPLRRETENLLAQSDSGRLFTVITSPNFLFADGEAIWGSSSAKLKGPVDELLGDGIQSVMLSLHLDESFFLEWRAIATADTKPTVLAQNLRSRVSALPNRVERYLVTLNPQPFGRLILFRLPQMVELLDRYTRFAGDQGQAVLRCYLPPEAGHNLLMGLELAIAEPVGAGSEIATQTNDSSPPKQTVQERLAQRTTLSFPRDTLEMAVKILSEDIGVEIRLAGSDLQLDGITKNQSFGVDLKDETAEEILTQILRLANPDKTASGPADPKQKLVYVVKPLDPGGPPGVLVTTRAQAEKRGDTLPKQFAENK